MADPNAGCRNVVRTRLDIEGLAVADRFTVEVAVCGPIGVCVFWSICPRLR